MARSPGASTSIPPPSSPCSTTRLRRKRQRPGRNGDTHHRPLARRTVASASLRRNQNRERSDRGGSVVGTTVINTPEQFVPGRFSRSQESSRRTKKQRFSSTGPSGRVDVYYYAPAH